MSKSPANFDQYYEVSDGTLEVEIPNDVHEKFRSDVDQVGLVVMGEVHGVRENTDVIQQVMCQFGIRRLLMEWSREDFENVMNSVVYGEELSESSDGRVTKAHVDLVKRLLADGAVDDIIPIDTKDDYESLDIADIWNERDAAMTERILDARKEGESPTLIVMGARHASREIKNWRGKPHVTAGSLLEAKGALYVKLEVEYQSGSYFNDGVKDFSTRASGISDNSYMSMEGERTYAIYISEAHASKIDSAEK